MKRLVAGLALFGFGVLASCTPSASELETYAAFIDQTPMPLATPIDVLDITICPNAVIDNKRIEQALRQHQVSAQTAEHLVLDFITFCLAPSRLTSAPPSRRTTRLVNAANHAIGLRNGSPPPGGPGGGSVVLMFSRVAFDAPKRQALLYAGDVDQGAYWLLVQEQAAWQLRARIATEPP